MRKQAHSWGVNEATNSGLKNYTRFLPGSPEGPKCLACCMSSLSVLGAEGLVWCRALRHRAMQNIPSCGGGPTPYLSHLMTFVKLLSRSDRRGDTQPARPS